MYVHLYSRNCNYRYMNNRILTTFIKYWIVFYLYKRKLNILEDQRPRLWKEYLNSWETNNIFDVFDESETLSPRDKNCNTCHKTVVIRAFVW